MAWLYAYATVYALYLAVSTELFLRVGLLIGVLTLFVGLIIIIPLIGYAAWHGYLETIDADGQ